MKIKIAYNIDDAGIIPTDFTVAYTSGSVGYGTVDDINPNLSAFKYWQVDEYEYQSEPDRIYNQAIEAGYVTPMGYTLALTDKDRAQFVSMLVLLREAGVPDGMETAISDNSGSLHTLTVVQLRQLLVGYGLYYQNLWSTYKSAL
jgi:hypothetical protein